MKNFTLILAMLFCQVSYSNASEEFLLTAEIIQNNEIIGSPQFILPEAVEGTATSYPFYSLTVTVLNEKEGAVLVKTNLNLSKNGALESVGKPLFVFNKGESGSIEIDHSDFGNIKLKITVTAYGRS